MKNIFKKFALGALLVGVGAGAWSCDPKENENTPATLAKPTEAKATDVTATTATLTWKAVEGADKYEVRVGDEASIKNTEDNSYLLTSLAPETEYTWQVRALKGNEVSDWAQGEAFTTEKGGTVAPDPIEPTNLTVSNITKTSATLSWVAPSEAPLGYDVRLNSGAISDAGNATSYPVSGLTPGTNYTWEVRARFDDTQSDWVSGNAFTTLPDDGGNDGEMSVSVNFGNGEEVWEAVYAVSYDYTADYGVIEVWMDSADEEFSLDVLVAPPGETNFPSSENYYVEYYSGRWYDVGEEIAEYMGDGYNYGDWWVDSGTVTITSFTSSLVSGTANLQMYDFYDYAINENDNPAVKNLTATFTNVPVEQPEVRSGAIRSALASPDKTFTFKNDRTRISKVR